MKSIFISAEVRFKDLLGRTLTRKVDFSEVVIKDAEHARAVVKDVIRHYYMIPSKNIFNIDLFQICPRK